MHNPIPVEWIWVSFWHPLAIFPLLLFAALNPTGIGLIAELQQIVNMDRIPNIFVFENLSNTKYE